MTSIFRVRRILLVVLLASALNAHAADLQEEDKEKHVGASAGISMISYGAFRAAKFGRLSSTVMSFTVAMAVGHIKETQDPFYDHKDMEANAVGATLGLVIPISFTF